MGMQIPTRIDRGWGGVRPGREARHQCAKREKDRRPMQAFYVPGVFVKFAFNDADA